MNQLFAAMLYGSKVRAFAQAKPMEPPEPQLHPIDSRIVGAKGSRRLMHRVLMGPLSYDERIFDPHETEGIFKVAQACNAGVAFVRHPDGVIRWQDKPNSCDVAAANLWAKAAFADGPLTGQTADVYLGFEEHVFEDDKGVRHCYGMVEGRLHHRSTRDPSEDAHTMQG